MVGPASLVLGPWEEIHGSPMLAEYYSACEAMLPEEEAIARGETEINRCPPGGAAGIEKLAALLQRPVLPLDPAHGFEKPRMLARIVEADCIGCTKCIQACPVDAIVGAAKHMHTVIEPLCTGCELCVPACPVDCIVMVIPDEAG